MFRLSSFFFLMIRRPPRSTLFPTRRSSDLHDRVHVDLPLVPRPRPREVEQAVDDAAAALHLRIDDLEALLVRPALRRDRKSTRLNSSHSQISHAGFCLQKKTQNSE